MAAVRADSSSEITDRPQPSEEEIQFILDAIAEYLTVEVLPMFSSPPSRALSSITCAPCSSPDPACLAQVHLQHKCGQSHVQASVMKLAMPPQSQAAASFRVLGRPRMLLCLGGRHTAATSWARLGVPHALLAAALIGPAT